MCGCLRGGVEMDPGLFPSIWATWRRVDHPPAAASHRKFCDASRQPCRCHRDARGFAESFSDTTPTRPHTRKINLGRVHKCMGPRATSPDKFLLLVGGGIICICTTKNFTKAPRRASTGERALRKCRAPRSLMKSCGTWRKSVESEPS